MLMTLPVIFFGIDPFMAMSSLLCKVMLDPNVASKNLERLVRGVEIPSRYLCGGIASDADLAPHFGGRRGSFTVIQGSSRRANSTAELSPALP